MDVHIKVLVLREIEIETEEELNEEDINNFKVEMIDEESEKINIIFLNGKKVGGNYRNQYQE